jgi:uncharacterized membrane protein
MFTSSHFHPMMVHFPIALLTIGFLTDLISVLYNKEQCLTKMGYWLEVTGMITTLLAFGTGYFFTNPMEGEAGLLRDRHAFFATITLITIVIATLFRILLNYQNKEQSPLKYVSLALFMLAFGFVSVTGYLGGSLVIDYMIGL